MQTYLLEMRVDEEWLKVIDKITNDVYEGEVCQWLRLDAETEGEN
jgi:ABC-type antimicrobial peptide transport system ATPase subunit